MKEQKSLTEKNIFQYEALNKTTLMYKIIIINTFVL